MCFSVGFAKFLRTPFYRTPLLAVSEKSGGEIVKDAEVYSVPSQTSKMELWV